MKHTSVNSDNEAQAAHVFPARDGNAAITDDQLIKLHLAVKGIGVDLLETFITVLWSAWLFSTAWLWFVTPLGLPSVSVIQVLGMRVLYKLWFDYKMSPPHDPSQDACDKAWRDLYTRAMVLALGTVIVFSLHRIDMAF